MTGEVSITLAFLGGLLSFLSPCVLPLVPSYLSFVTGISVEELLDDQKGDELKKIILLNSIVFILGFTTVFVSLGASASFAGEIITRYQDVIRKVGGIIIVILGVHIIGVININILHRDKRLHFFHEKPVGFVGSYLVGVGFAAGWTPCIGPILASVLIVAASSESIGRGILLLFSYSMGLAIPLLLSSLAIDMFLQHFSRLRKYMRFISIITGGFLVIVGILIYFNYFATLTEYFNRIIPWSV